MRFAGISAYTGKYTEIRTRDGRIEGIGAREAPAQGGPLPVLSRGLTDIQVNGYRGVDYSGEALSEEGMLQVVHDLARAGTLRHLPTLITGSRAQTRDNLRRISDAVERNTALKAAVAGIHLEGPYISGMDGARGAHDARHVRDPGIDELRDWQEAARGMVRLVTVAPEREGAPAFIRAAADMGITVALGHTLATGEQIEEAVRAGARLSTHLGNGSPAMLPRLRNHIWAQLANDELYASLIADGFHLPADTLKVFARAKGLGRVILTSDVGPMGGLAPGRYEWGNTSVEVHPDGHLGLAGTEYLAGAGHLLDRCVAFFREAVGCTLPEALAAASDVPVRFLGLDAGTGDFKIGEPADVVCLEEAPGRLRVLSWALGAREQANEAEGG
ncbi:MAG TPA: amidohydrolase family protein [Candidatus Limnocylindria bacterium]|nr:amidohydrolase family protein [Candidatus Limnocylindria bacterium]